VVIVAATGPDFSAGLDRAVIGTPSDGGTAMSGAQPNDDADGLLAQLARGPAERTSAALAGYQQAFSWLARPDLVSIAAVQGHAIGAGLQLALACDLRVAARSARLAMAELRLGLVPDLGGTKRLVELIGYSRAARLCLTGQLIEADEAERIGLVNQVVDPADLLSAARSLAQGVLDLPRDAVVETKALLAAASQRTQAEQQQAERDAQFRRLRDVAGLIGEDDAR
jgi:enoyl-CoA hydratase/carnithine racemase